MAGFRQVAQGSISMTAYADFTVTASGPVPSSSPGEFFHDVILEFHRNGEWQGSVK